MIVMLKVAVFQVDTVASIYFIAHKPHMFKHIIKPINHYTTRLQGHSLYHST